MKEELINSIIKKKNIQVLIKDSESIEWTNLGIYKWNNEKNIYEGLIDSFTLDDIKKIINKNIELDHLKIEVAIWLKKKWY